MKKSTSSSGAQLVKSHSGVSLIDLMIVVAIIGILSAIAVPAYRAFIERSHRVEAISTLEQIATDQWRLQLDTNTFTADWDALGFPGGLSTNGVYVLDFPVAPDTDGFMIRAQPATGGGTNGVDQTSDESCQWFTLDEKGRRASGPSPDCWAR